MSPRSPSTTSRSRSSSTSDLGDPNRADRVRHRGALRNQDIDLAQLRNDLFGGVSLLTLSDPPSALTSHTSGWTTPTGAAQAALPGSEVKGAWARKALGQERRLGKKGAWARKALGQVCVPARGNGP